MHNALIIGAGIAGPVAAMALQRAGFEAVIYEAREQGADDVGAFLTLQTNGVSALRAIGADHVVAELGFPTPTMRLHSTTGKHLGTVPNGGPLPDGTVSHTVERADLYQALRDEALRRGIGLEYGKRLADATHSSGRVTATFRDGSGASGDVLIGCDGIRSRTRAIIDPASPPARFVPVLNIGGFAPIVTSGAEVGDFHMIFGARAFFGWTSAPGGETWWFANPPAQHEPTEEELRGITTEQWHRRLEALFAVDRSPAVEVIRATPHPLRGWATYDIPTIPTWHAGSMVVIGDAAHATAPSSGQGASLAIEDAVVLAKCLRDRPTIQAALESYEGLRRERVERVVAAGARTSSMKAVGPVGRRVRDLVMPFFLRRVAADGAASLAWMHQYHIDWDSPTPAAATS